MRLLRALADSTAVALENVRMIAELEDRVKERTAELEQTNLRLRDTNAELEAAQEMAESVSVAIPRPVTNETFSGAPPRPRGAGERSERGAERLFRVRGFVPTADVPVGFRNVPSPASCVARADLAPSGGEVGHRLRPQTDHSRPSEGKKRF